MTRLAIVCTHPIQYLAPAFRALAIQPGLEIKVFYGLSNTESAYDPGFGQTVTWDIPLLDGYAHEFVPNIAKSPGSDRFSGMVLPDLNRRIEAWNADAILVYGWSYDAHLKAMRYFKGKIPVFFRGDSTLLDEVPGVKRVIRRVFLRWIYKHVDVAFSVGTNNRDYLLRHGLRASQIVHAPHAVDNSRFDAGQSEDLRKELKIPDSAPVFAFVGKLEWKKAPDLLLDAFLKLDNSTAHLIFVGAGDLEVKLKLRENARIHFLGFQNQTRLPSVYKAADLTALPSRGPGETWGLVLNEAMSCCRAVLASDRVGAAVDLVQTGRNGWIVKANDLNSLANALQLASDMGRQGLVQYGQQGAGIISQWTIENQVKQIAATTLDRVVQKRNKPG